MHSSPARPNATSENTCESMPSTGRAVHSLPASPNASPESPIAHSPVSGQTLTGFEFIIYRFICLRSVPKTQITNEWDLELVSGADFWCNLHDFSSRGRSRGSLGPEGLKIGQKPAGGGSVTTCMPMRKRNLHHFTLVLQARSTADVNYGNGPESNLKTPSRWASVHCSDGCVSCVKRLAPV